MPRNPKAWQREHGGKGRERPNRTERQTSRTGFLKFGNIFKNRQISLTEIQLGTSELEKYRIKVQKEGFLFISLRQLSHSVFKTSAYSVD